MSDHDSSFLSRWSRRKVQGREGAALPDEAASRLSDETAAPLPAPAPTLAGAAALAPLAVPAAPAAQPPPAQAPIDQSGVVPPAPTLADVAALSAQSDYTRFVARDVTPEVKNAALKKLFTDPHFNLMDGLDTYIDDYGKPDPLPAGMLRQMVQSHLLGLFDDEKENDTADTVQAPPPAPLAAQETPVALNSTAVSTPNEDEVRSLPADVAAAQGSAEPGAGRNS